eukprot:TRINITY_DN5881_c0_g1_i1.p1 TRINITY_DN5881_c0_g1~~TRINITY_DN5881_c0_g1_i1.p1  ORF type:complete len:599 (+),score=122.66 TRINITY_DN5881_c0_g1_i1:131-1927(+)
MSVRLLSSLVLFACVTLVACELGNHGLDNGHPSRPSSQLKQPWAVKLRPGADPDAIAAEHGFLNVGPHKKLSDVYLFETPDHHDQEAIQRHLTAHPDVKWHKAQEAKPRHRRSDFVVPPEDPLYSDQWHLHGSKNIDVNVEPVWKMGYTGKGVTVAVVDDGLDYTHPDFGNKGYNSESSYDFNFQNDDPMPYKGGLDSKHRSLPVDRHGTAAAGCATADEDGTCGVGAAPGADAAGIRLIAEDCNDFQESEALSFRADLNDIYSCSWGPPDDGRRLEGPETLLKEAWAKAILEGRGGKGPLYVWASGNGLMYDDDCNYDGYANSRYSITVGSFDETGKQPWYSEGCAALLITTPSGGHQTRISTTGLVESGEPQCYTNFYGTSASAPIAAGVLALVLEARPDLTWRDVQGVLAESAVVVDENDEEQDGKDGGWHTNTAGYHHNHKYGFGRLDAEKTVNAALAWTLWSQAEVIESGKIVQNEEIKSGKQKEFTYALKDENDAQLVLEHIEVHVEMDLVARGRAKISLVSDTGVTSVLQTSHNDGGKDIDWTYMTVRNWGETLGTKEWKLIVEITKGHSTDAATFDSWSLTFHGHFEAKK